MITPEMIESKIDRLVEEGYYISYDNDYGFYGIDIIDVNRFIIYVNNDEVVKDYERKIYNKLEKLYKEQVSKGLKLRFDIIKYLNT